MIKTSIPPYFHERRLKLATQNPGAAFILPGTREVLRNIDVGFPFRQETNLYYLTGYDEPDAWAILLCDPASGGAYKLVFFSRERNPEREIWDGARYGIEGATRIFGAHESYPVSELTERLPGLLKSSDKIFYRLNLNESNDRTVLSALDSVRASWGRAGKSLSVISDPQEQIGEMRLFKSASEADCLRKAAKISAQAHQTLMQETKPGMNEAEIEALFDYLCRKNGCGRMGYGSIVAGGANATCLHYHENNEPLQDGQLLLVDAAGEYDYYSADITRTFPIGKRFSQEQAELYEIVLNTQKTLIGMAKPGIRYGVLHKTACEMLTDGLIARKIVDGKRDDLLQSMMFKRFYPHGTGHYLGMEVHDTGLYLKNGESRTVEAGMVFTIEPGIYFQSYDLEVADAYRGIGIRIEDDLLITETGNENLSILAPKEISDIEALKR